MGEGAKALYLAVEASRTSLSVEESLARLTPCLVLLMSATVEADMGSVARELVDVQSTRTMPRTRCGEDVRPAGLPMRR